MDDDLEAGINELPKRTPTRAEVLGMVRDAMSEAFPGLEFTFRDREQDTLHQNFAPPNLVVGWIDGPSAVQLERIIGRFSGPGWSKDQEGGHHVRFIDDVRSAGEQIPQLLFMRHYSDEATDEAMSQDYDQHFPQSYAMYQNGERPQGFTLYQSGTGVTQADRARVKQVLEERSYMPTQPSATAAKVKILDEDQVRVLVERRALQQVAQQVALEQQARGQAEPVALGRRRL
ncbi:hypothetical protein SAMN05216466_10690 [Paraburkholderia phenazinium]|uniref:Large polyvalent protein associated domain-containing protein n=1 Tax=Paraburkholderia phenazinium TaxID=60549 RepID=A0A1G7Y9J3_9BURK|nr:hypothetical protein [Paraburkholderia phenazinium]SDG92993.1 hypothetical protein SAMN05216466_10690 [Paraburkholderia phenazinium]